MTTVEAVRQSVAKYCANILHGNHARKQPVMITVKHTLACVSFQSNDDQNDLAWAISDHLRSMLKKDCSVSFDIFVIPQDDNEHLRIIGSICRR